MSERSPDNPSLELGTSRALAVVFAVVHGGALVLALILPVAVVLRLGLAAFVAFSFWQVLWRHALRRSADAVVALALEDDEACRVRRRGASDWIRGRRVGEWVHPLLAIVVVCTEDRRLSRATVIAADAAPADAFRRLRVQLRLRAAAASGSYRAARSADRAQGNPA